MSILLVTWNGRTLLERCLASVRRAAAGLRVQVIVVDNGSSDGTAGMLAEAHPEVEYLPLGRNYGFAGANNRGVRAAVGEFVFLLNNDTIVEPDALTALLEAARRYPEFDVFAPEMVCLADPRRVDNRGIFLEATGHLRQLDAGRPSAVRRERAEVFGACGGAMLVRREVIERHGLFDEALESYLEDADLACRLRAVGVRTLYVPESRILHEGSATGNRIADHKFYLIQRNMVTVRRRWIPFHPLRLTSWAGVAYELSQVARAAASGRLALVLRAKRDGLRAGPSARATGVEAARVREWAGARARPVVGREAVGDA